MSKSDNHDNNIGWRESRQMKSEKKFYFFVFNAIVVLILLFFYFNILGDFL